MSVYNRIIVIFFNYIISYLTRKESAAGEHTLTDSSTVRKIKCFKKSDDDLSVVAIPCPVSLNG